ncbi:hypothetical protein RJT34_17270 [Clitoria ternatea]|uniref:Uncharacterized protein n=1 Tax=Clitoria ternatea TaxID=43366 RepID=A0AAN9PDM2_CLITE
MAPKVASPFINPVKKEKALITSRFFNQLGCYYEKLTRDSRKFIVRHEKTIESRVQNKPYVVGVNLIANAIDYKAEEVVFTKGWEVVVGTDMVNEALYINL